VIGLRDDFYNLSASLAKLDLLFRLREDAETKGGTSRMVATEVEYIFSVCRSIFDLLQEIIAKLWASVSLLDTTIKKRQLKKSFGYMVLLDGTPRTRDDLISKFGMPQALADCYARNSEFFLLLRTFRDNIVHNGSRVPIIFSTEKGFAVRETVRPFSDFNVWTEEHKQENGLCHLQPALGYAINRTIGACEDFSQTLETIIRFPPPIAPGLKLFMRGYFNAHLIASLDAVNNCQW